MAPGTIVRVLPDGGALPIPPAAHPGPRSQGT
jgi:hypothetical protein